MGDHSEYGGIPLPPTAAPGMLDNSDSGGISGDLGGSGFGRGRGGGPPKKSFKRNEGDWDCPKYGTSSSVCVFNLKRTTQIVFPFVE